jgi:hypothetical protein
MIEAISAMISRLSLSGSEKTELLEWGSGMPISTISVKQCLDDLRKH